MVSHSSSRKTAGHVRRSNQGSLFHVPLRDWLMVSVENLHLDFATKMRSGPISRAERYNAIGRRNCMESQYLGILIGNGLMGRARIVKKRQP